MERKNYKMEKIDEQLIERVNQAHQEKFELDKLFT